ncbi:MAG: glycosyltransferase family 2 protein [Chitinivibrionales bacterium]|nr:glycosyltransferase family 2 protein [Chitinivibrionales bacterium]
MSRRPRYVIITPVRNEEEYLGKTIASVAEQTIHPVEWVIVDDGSTDATASIMADAAKRYRWIHPVARTDRGFRKSGAGVIEAFYEGYNQLRIKKWDYIVKLDGDLSFEKNYFERCFETFSVNPKLGIAGGIIYNLIDGALIVEKHALFHVRGATKIYSRECWDAINGLLCVRGWDTLDEIKANMVGWESMSIPELHLIHYRPTGSANGWWRNHVVNGLSDYICGYHPLFMAVKIVKRIFERPYIISSLGLLVGFCSGYTKRVRRVDDPRLIRFIRHEQINRLLLRTSLWEKNLYESGLGQTKLREPRFGEKKKPIRSRCHRKRKSTTVS